MPFQYKKVLVIGATSGSCSSPPCPCSSNQSTGIGEALAEKLIVEGCSVIVTGRRKENLDGFVERHQDKATAVAFDINKLDEIPEMVRNITTTHSDIDCVVLNSGIQRRSGKRKSSFVFTLLIAAA